MDFKKALKDFWYGKPHTAEDGGRRLGENYLPKTGLYTVSYTHLTLPTILLV